MSLSWQLFKPTINIIYLVIIYLVIALSFVFIANDNSFNVLINTPTFYTDVLFSIIVTFATGYYLNTINNKLNQSISWYQSFKPRLLKQFLYGILIPLIIAMVLEILYLYSIHIPIRESAILNLELPLAFIFLTLINIAYLAIYLFQHKQTEIVTIKESIMPTCQLEYIIVQKGFLEDKIELNNCAFIVSANKLLWLHTFDGEKYRIQGTMEHWEEKLMKSNFYRINRQYITSLKAIQSVEQTETRKLKVNFVLPTDEVYISKPNVSNFRKWWKQ